MSSGTSSHKQLYVRESKGVQKNLLKLLLMPVDQTRGLKSSQKHIRDFRRIEQEVPLLEHKNRKGNVTATSQGKSGQNTANFNGGYQAQPHRERLAGRVITLFRSLTTQAPQLLEELRLSGSQSAKITWDELLFGLLHSTSIDIKAKYLCGMLCVAARKAVTKEWLKPASPSTDDRYDIMYEISVMERITFSTALQKSNFEEILERSYPGWDWWS